MGAQRARGRRPSAAHAEREEGRGKERDATTRQDARTRQGGALRSRPYVTSDGRSIKGGVARASRSMVGRDVRPYRKVQLCDEKSGR
jgi:hypothetical protein